jgi:hypothetical protein
MAIVALTKLASNLMHRLLELLAQSLSTPP